MPSLKKIATLHVDGIPNRDYVNCDTSVYNYDGLNDYHIDFFDAGKLSDVTELALYIKLGDDENISRDDLECYIDEISTNTNINVTGYTPLVDFEEQNKKSKENLADALRSVNELLEVKPHIVQIDASKTLLDKIKDATTNCAILQISTEVTMYEYSYDEGELDKVNNYDLDSKLFVVPFNDSIDLEIYKKVKTYIEEELSLVHKDDNLIESISSCLDENYFNYSGLTDSDGVYATDSELDEWEEGNYELYNKDCFIRPFLNGNPIQSNLFLEIIKSGQQKYIDETKKEYSVWVGGTEVNDVLLTKNEALALVEKYTNDGYDDVELDKVEDSKDAEKKSSVKKNR